MANKKALGKGRGAKASGNSSSARATVSGPSRREKQPDPADAADRKAAGTQELAAVRPFNPNKAGEHGKAALRPEPGATAEPPHPSVTASTLSELSSSPKLGSGSTGTARKSCFARDASSWSAARSPTSGPSRTFG